MALAGVVALILAAGCGDIVQPETTEGARTEELLLSDAKSVAGADLILTADANGRNIVVAVDGGDGQVHDGVADHVFVLQRGGALEEGMAPGSPIQLRNASISYSNDLLAIHHKDYSAVLSLESAFPEREAVRRVALNGRTITEWVGFGLSHTTGAKVDFRAASLQNVEGFLCDNGLVPGLLDARIDSDEGGEGDCMHGGEGSSECSYTVAGTGCSVTCEEGYYACCNLSGCKCVRDEPE